jgi:hypothetical protein
MPADILDIIFVFAVLVIVIFVFIRIAIKLRKSGGSMTTLMYGATDEFYNKEKKKAIEYISEQKADKKTNEQTSGEGQ